MRLPSLTMAFVLVLVGGAWTLAVEPKTVSLVVNFGDGAEKHLNRLPWREGMTVLDVMSSAARHPRGVRFEHRGRGATAFLTQIDGLKNEGGGRNWIFRVNGKLGVRSFAVRQLKEADQVEWRFGAYP